MRLSQRFMIVVVVQLPSCVQLFATPMTAALQASLSFTISWSLLKLMSIESMMPSNQVILCCPLLLPPSIFPSIRVFSNKSALHIRWPKYWSFSINPSNEYSGLIFFKINWFDLLAVQGTFKRTLQHHSLKTWILWCSAFFMVQFSQPCMTTGKTIALTIRTFFKNHLKFCCCCCSVTKSYPTLWDPMDCSTPGSSVLQYLPEFPQIHMPWVGDAV